MSGGHYNYTYRYLADLALDIKDDIDNQKENLEFPKDILKHMEYISQQLQIYANACRDLEWYMSCDYGDDTLRDRCDSFKLSEEYRKSN